MVYVQLFIAIPQIFSYNIARMRFEISLAPEAVQDLKKLKAHQKSAVRAGIEKHLRYEPRKISKSRIKRLRGLRRPQYRLRLDEIRVFYDVSERSVEILAIIPKSQAVSWIEQLGEKR